VQSQNDQPAYTSFLQQFRSFSKNLPSPAITDSSNILCRFELHGTCNDPDCPYTHLGKSNRPSSEPTASSKQKSQKDQNNKESLDFNPYPSPSDLPIWDTDLLKFLFLSYFLSSFSFLTVTNLLLLQIERFLPSRKQWMSHLTLLKQKLTWVWKIGWLWKVINNFYSKRCECESEWWRESKLT